MEPKTIIIIGGYNTPDSYFLMKHYQSVFLAFVLLLLKFEWISGADGILEKQLKRVHLDRDDARNGIKNDLLCAVVYGSSQDAASTLTINLNTTKGLCDWAIIVYSGLPVSDSFICRREGIRKQARICHLSTQNIHRRMGNGSLPKNSRSSIPKTIYYREVIKLAPNYRYILFLDEDIVINGEDMRKSLDFLSCGDYGGERPLLAHLRLIAVSQPHLRQRSSMFAAEVSSISPKATIFDSRFFVWFTKNVLEATRQYSLSVGVDWGPSAVWAQAARDFGTEVLSYGTNFPVCVEIVGGSMMDLDFHTFRMKYDYPDEYEKGGNDSIKLYRELFPSWAEDVIKGNMGPHRVFKQLVSSCIANRTAAVNSGKRKSTRNN